MSSLARSVASDAFADAIALLHGLELDDPAVAPPLRLETRAALRAQGDSRLATWRPDPGERVALPASLTNAPTVVEAATALCAGKTSTRALVESALAAHREWEELGAIVALDEDAVLAEADVLDRELQRGALRGPLHGVPLTVKDVIHVAGLPSRGGSLAYAAEPATDAIGVARLRAAGALILAKAATHEFALGVTTPQCGNPYDASRLAGGSSGGSAIAVATGIGLASLGTDTRASLRVPAALCGVVGFKPTFGAVPTQGIVPLSWTIDHLGPITRTVEDGALLLEILTGKPVPRAGSDDLNGLVVGVPTEFLESTEPAVIAAFHAALTELERLGCALVALDRPSAADLDQANALGLVVSRAEAAAFHRAQGTELELCIPEVRDQLRAGLEVSAADYLDAQRHRDTLARETLTIFEACDVIATPTIPITAPSRGDYEHLLLRLSRNTILWSLVGAPAVSLPVGSDADGLPVGLQLVAAPHGEATLARVGVALEWSLA